MRSIGMRVVCVVFSLLLIAGYIFCPQIEERTVSINSGRGKLELKPGDRFSWPWVPSLSGSVNMGIELTGLKKANDITLTLELLDDQGKLLSSQSGAVRDLGKNEMIGMEVVCKEAEKYTVSVGVSGEGSIKLKGVETPEGDFLPAMREKGQETRRNPTVLYFAIGLLLLAATPVFNVKNRKVSKTEDKKQGVSAFLPWGTLMIILVTGIIIICAKPVLYQNTEWMGWDEEAHHEAVFDMAWDGAEAFPRIIHTMITWNPGYLPMALGVSIGRLFTVDSDVLYRIGVAFGLAAYGLMSALAVWHAPKYKATFMVVAAMPILMFLSTSMTYDTMVFSSLLLGVSLLLETRYSAEMLSSSRAVTLIALFAFGTVAKPVYSLMILLLLFIPGKQIGDRKWIFRLFVLLMLLWCLSALLMPGAYDSVRYGDSRYDDTNAAEQIRYVLSDPARFIGILFDYLISFREYIFVSYISLWCWQGENAVLNQIWLILLYFLCPLCAVGENQESRISKGSRSVLGADIRILMAVLAVLCLLILEGTQYIVSTPVGSGFINGMQSRYTLPVCIALVLPFMFPEKIRIKTRVFSSALALLLWGTCMGANVWYALHMLPL